jgi:hypothetical protein
MNRIFLRIWAAWSDYLQRSTDYSWFTPKVVAAFVIFLYLMNWILIVVVGKRHFLTLRATMPKPGWYIDSIGRPQPSILIVAFLLSVAAMVAFFSPWGRKIKIPYRSVLLAMALAGMLALVTELWLRF